MPVDATDRMKIVIYYAAWVIVCAAAAGIVTALIHTLGFSYVPTRPRMIATFLGDAGIALALAAAQGAVALATGSILAQLGRGLRLTVLLGVCVGMFDFLMYFVKMAVPASELGWLPDIAVLVGVMVLITVSGIAPRSAA